MYAVVCTLRVSESNYDNMPVHVRDPLVWIGLVTVLVLSCMVSPMFVDNILRMDW